MLMAKVLPEQAKTVISDYLLSYSGSYVQKRISPDMLKSYTFDICRKYH